MQQSKMTTIKEIFKLILIAIVFYLTVWIIIPAIIDWIVRLAIATVW